MKILYVYRSKSAGPSIRRVFEPIAEQLSRSNEVESIFLPFEGASIISIWKNIKFLRNHLKTNSYDIIHVTGDVYYLLWGLHKYDVVVTVHDLLFYTRINSKLKRKMMYFLELFPLRYANAITYISDASREEASRFIPLQKVVSAVVYNPVSPSFQPSRKEFNKDCPTILHLGTKPNKNLPRVLEALSGVKCKLHIVGNVSEEQKKKIEDLHIEAILESNISDGQILQAYKDCDIVSFPSLYEGFGMPIIEGQMIGRIVVTSNIEPMKSVAGEAAILINPYDISSVRGGFFRALNAQDGLVEKGYHNAKRFSVESISEQYYRIYRTII